MSATLHILLLFLSWVAVAAGCHVFIRNYFLASFVAACAIVIITQAAGYLELGHLDPYWQVSALTGFFMAGIVALMVGLPFRVKRTMKDDDV